MKLYNSILFFFVFLFLCSPVYSQKTKTNYSACFLADSVEIKLTFIQQNALRIFKDTSDCKQNVLDNIGALYVQTGDKKYLAALENIHQRAGEKVENLYTDIIKRFCEKDFIAFASDLFLAKGQYFNLEKELIETMNMIVGTQPLKQKYLGVLNAQIEKVREEKDNSAIVYWEKLKKRIENDK